MTAPLTPERLAEVRARVGAATIPGFPGYEVDTDGVVWSTQNWRGRGRRPITPIPGAGGYPKVRLSRPDGTRANRAVHRLVAAAYLGPRQEGQQVRHLNGDLTDSRLANLAYGSAKENAADRDAHQTTARGERNGQARLNQATVRRLRDLERRGLSQRGIAEATGVSQRTVGRVLRGEGWSHV